MVPSPVVRVVAAVVAYRPDEELLRECVAAAARQVDRVVVVDNGSGAARPGLEAEAAAGRIDLVTNPGNVGMARALNQALQHAAGLGADWALLLDQDTRIADGLVASLTADVPDDAAIMCPRVVDRHLADSPDLDLDLGAGPAQRDVDSCITSGAVYRTSACLQVGGYDEALFVDFVDFDLCTRLRAEGLRIVERRDAVIEHAIGRQVRHGALTARNHSAERCYHIARDTLHYSYKHRHRPAEQLWGGRGLLRTHLHLAKKAAVVVAFEDDKLAKVGALVRGTASATLEAWRSGRSREGVTSQR